MSYYIIIRGPLGVGKTTIAKKLSKILNAEYISIDKVMEKYRLDKVSHYESTIPAKNFIKGNELVLSRVKKSLNKGKIVIFDGCFHQKPQLNHLLKKLPGKHYAFTLKAPLKVCIKRDSKRKKVYGKDAAKAVHYLVSRFDYGITVNIGKQKLEETVNVILNNLIKIRRLKSSDIPHVAKISRGEKAVEDYPGEYSAEVFRGILKDKSTTVLVAEQNKKPIGFMEFSNDKAARRLFIWAVAVAKERRGKGIGSLLIKKAEEIAKKLKSTRVGFAVKDWNKSMQRLAKKLRYFSLGRHIWYDKKI